MSSSCCFICILCFNNFIVFAAFSLSEPALKVRSSCFMSGPEKKPYFGQYPPDFFDLVIVDECHRGGAKDESRWRGILEYFSSAVQIGLTATPGGYYNEQTQELADYFDKNKISITDENFNDLEGPDAIKYLQNIGVLSEIKTHQVKTDFNFEFNESEKQKILGSFDEGLSPELIKQMEKDVERNICIYGELQSLYEQNY